MKDEFLTLYKKDFEITGGGKMETFLGMAIEQNGKSIKIHLDNYIKDVLTEYSSYIKKSLTGRARLQRGQTPPRWQQPSHHRRCEALLQTRPWSPCERARQPRQCGTLNHFKKEQAMDSFPQAGSGWKGNFLLLRSPAHVDGRVAGKQYKSLWLESTDRKIGKWSISTDPTCRCFHSWTNGYLPGGLQIIWEQAKKVGAQL